MTCDFAEFLTAGVSIVDASVVFSLGLRECRGFCPFCPSRGPWYVEGPGVRSRLPPPIP